MVITAAQPARGSRVFYVGIAGALLLFVLAGFAPSLAALPTGALPPLVQLHALVFLAWMVLLILQASLVARGRVAVHRRLGMSFVVLVPIMLVLGYLTAIFGARRGHPLWKSPEQVVPPGFPFEDSLEFLVVPLGDLAVFAPFVAIAFLFRGQPAIHKRAMLLATIGGMLPPATTRLPLGGGATQTLIAFVLFILFIAACIAHDYYERGRLHPLNLWGGIALIGSVPLRAAVAHTNAWHSFAEWLTR